MCEKYHNVKTPYKHQAIINNLSKNNDVVILKQDKSRGIVILNRSKYIEKYLSLLDSNQFAELYHDPTDSIERKLQGHYEKLKQNFHQIFIRKYIQQVPHLASYAEQQKFINLIPMGKSIICQLDQ